MKSLEGGGAGAWVASDFSLYGFGVKTGEVT